MNLLVDTHALLWWWAANDRLSRRAHTALRSPANRIYVSAAVGWELAIKVNLGKLDARHVLADFPAILFDSGFKRLAIAMDHALRAGMLPRHHNDPFDRMLVAQAQALGFPIISADATFDQYGIERIW